MYKTRNTGTGNRMRRTWGIGGMLYSGECCQILRGMSPNIPGNVAQHSGKRPQTLWEMSSNIQGNVAKHTGEFPQTFREMSSNILGNVCHFLEFQGNEDAGSVQEVSSGEVISCVWNALG